ncbi:hypothetical protein KJZ99_00050 [bacterium]|nr:hypothetical protein [bacterium]
MYRHIVTWFCLVSMSVGMCQAVRPWQQDQPNADAKALRAYVDEARVASDTREVWVRIDSVGYDSLLGVLAIATVGVVRADGGEMDLHLWLPMSALLDSSVMLRDTVYRKGEASRP